jgi:hypothetical protein
MSATELVAEKVKGLTEKEAELILLCIDGIRGPSPSASELFLLPREVRQRIFAAQVDKAVETGLYDDPELRIGW